MTDTEYESHFVMWALLKAPLILGCDLGSLSENQLKIIKNNAVIAINQDSKGVQIKRL